MAFMRRILWFDSQGHKHVTWKSMGDDSSTTIPVPTPATLPTGTTQPASTPSTSLFGSLPWYVVGGAAAAAYYFLFKKKG